MLRSAAIGLTASVAAAAALAAASTSAGAAGGALELKPAGMAGFCIPPGNNGALVASTIGSANVPATPTKPIAILDTGVDPTAPGLAGRVQGGFDALGAGGVGDADGHGTQVAGIAAAAPGPLVGVSPASPIYPVRIFNDAGVATADAVVKGIQAAVGAGAGVISISGAAKAADVSAADQNKIRNAVNEAFAAGALVVAASGNDGDTTVTVPANLPHVLVAGAGNAQVRAAFSNATTFVDVVSPAEELFSPLPPALCEFGYGSATGTSFAAPALAGAAALVSAQRAGLTAQQRFELLRRNATDIGTAGRDNDTGFGLLNVPAALGATPLAKETYPEVDDDIFWVKGKYAAKHPVLMKKTKRFKAVAAVNPAKDPADVIPIHLVKGERVVVTVTADDDASLLELSIFSPKAGNFDVSNGVQKTRLVGTGGLSPGPDLELVAKQTGTHYVAVETSDAMDDEDPEAVIPDTQTYRISAFKQRKKAKAKKKKK